MFKTSRAKEAVWLQSGRQGTTSCPTGWSPSMSSLLGQGNVPFRWAEAEFIQVSSSTGAGAHSGVILPGSQAGTPACSFQPHLQLLDI